MTSSAPAENLQKVPELIPFLFSSLLFSSLLFSSLLFSSLLFSSLLFSSLLFSSLLVSSRLVSSRLVSSLIVSSFSLSCFHLSCLIMSHLNKYLVSPHLFLSNCISFPLLFSHLLASRYLISSSLVHLFHLLFLCPLSSLVSSLWFISSCLISAHFIICLIIYLSPLISLPLLTDPSCLDSSIVSLGLLVSLRLIVYHFMSSSLIWYPLVHLAHFLFSPISPMSLPLDSSHFFILSHLVSHHLVSSHLLPALFLVISLLVLTPLLSSSSLLCCPHIIRSHLNSSQAFFLLIWSLLFQCLCFVFVLSCTVSNVQSSSRLLAFPYFLAYFLLYHLLSCRLSTFSIIPCLSSLLLSSHLLYLLLSRFLSLHLASSCFVSSQFYSSPCLLTFSCFNVFLSSSLLSPSK